MFFSFIFPPFFVCFYFGHKSGYPRDVPAVTSCFSSFKDIPTGEIEWNGRRVVGHFKRKRKSKWVSKKSRHRSLSKQNSSVTSLEGGGGIKKRRSALLAKKFPRNFALCDSLYVTPTSSLFTIGAAASFDQTWQLPTGSCLHFIGNNQTKLALSCKKWE